MGFAGHAAGLAGDAVGAQQTDAPGELVVVGGDHAALAAGDDFDGVEAVGGGVGPAAVADALAFVFAAEGVGGVFEDLEAVFYREGVDARHVAGLPGEVDGDDDFGQGAVFFGFDELCLQAVRAHEDGAGVHVHEVYLGAAVAPGIGGGDEGDGCGPKPVAMAEAEGFGGAVEGGGAVGHGDAVAGAAPVGDGVFKAGDGGPLGEVVGLQDLDDGGDVGLVEALASVGQEGGAHASTVKLGSQCWRMSSRIWATVSHSVFLPEL